MLCPARMLGMTSAIHLSIRNTVALVPEPKFWKVASDDSMEKMN